MRKVILQDQLDSLESHWHSVFFSFFKEMLQNTFEELFTCEDFEFEVVPESSPDVASVQVVFDF